jgi:5-methyltetrahydropteroyltriglutamate--homocysteine methyltransferase
MQNDIASNRIYTTHVGSLPRPESLLELMRAKTGGQDFDEAALETELAVAVRAVVERQVSTGIDIVSDGEFSKPSYATYVAERLTGFDGEFSGHAARDLLDYRAFAQHLVEIGGVVPTAGGACCRGPV